MCVVHACSAHRVADKNIQVKRTIKIITEQSIMSVTLFPLSSTLCEPPFSLESLTAPLPAEAFGRDTTFYLFLNLRLTVTFTSREIFS